MSAVETHPDDEKLTIVEEKVILSTGEVTTRRYQKGRFLGKGGFARCYEFVSLETKKLFAGKVVLKESLKKSRAKQKLMSEIKIHRSVQHQGIVNFEHFFEDSVNVYILLEMCSNQTFSEMVRRRKRLTELEVQCYLVQLVAALKYLQEHKIIHRDLKLGNMFLTDKMESKIGDFGLATRIEFEGERKRTICGTPNYIAPEVLDNRIGHSFEVDVWSLGVVIYTMLVGRPPFETSDVKTTYKRIRTCAYTFPETVALSSQAKGLITRILVADPSKRPSYDEILANDFLNQGNSIPRLMPSSTLSCPPSTSYLQQFMLNAAPTSSTERIADTERLGSGTPVRVVATLIDSLPQTDRLRVPIPLSLDVPQVQSSSRRTASDVSACAPTIWVTKWVDYSSKYGLGYEVNNSTMGVFFNDSSKILLAADGYVFFYAEKKQGQKQDVIVPFTLTEFPKAIQKKVTLLQHFRSYLEGEAKQETRIEEVANRSTEPIFVKKWLKTKHAVLFRLTNKVIQVIFQDHTELLISSDTKILTYVDKRNERSAHTMASALEGSSREIAKRLTYTKDLLAHMLGKQDPETYRKSENEV